MKVKGKHYGQFDTKNEAHEYGQKPFYLNRKVPGISNRKFSLNGKRSRVPTIARPCKDELTSRDTHQNSNMHCVYEIASSTTEKIVISFVSQLSSYG